MWTDILYIDKLKQLSDASISFMEITSWKSGPRCLHEVKLINGLILTLCRFIDALRAQMKERLSQEKLDLPPLCCCASSFWDSHPDTCANNCVFHNNPKGTRCTHTATCLTLYTLHYLHSTKLNMKTLLTEAFVSSTEYAKALHSTMLSLELQ